MDPITINTIALGICLYVYRNIMEIKKYSPDKVVLLKALLCILATTVSIPLLLPVICIFFLYRQAVALVLKMQHGTRFRGLLSGADAFHAVNEPSQYVTVCLHIVGCRAGTSPQEFYECVRDCFRRSMLPTKFWAAFLKGFGYSYIVDQDLSVDDCIKIMGESTNVNSSEDKMEMTDFKVLLEDYYNKPLPVDPPVHLQILIGARPIKWREDDLVYYPIVTKNSHAVSDGVTLIKILVTFFADKLQCKTEPLNDSFSLVYGDNKFQFNSKVQVLLDKIKHSFKVLFTIMHIILLAPAAIVAISILKGNDSNVMYKQALSGHKLVAFAVEQKQEYVRKVKNIKNKIPGTGFPNVLMAAFTASFHDYFKKRSLTPPQRITAAIPFIPGLSKIEQDFASGKINRNNISAQNTYTPILISLPIASKEIEELGEKSLTHRLTSLNKEANLVNNSAEYHMSLIFMSVICAVLPYPVLKYLLKYFRCTVIPSILPGPPKLTFAEGKMQITNIVPWVPHLHNIGISFCVLTYNNLLHMGLMIDEAIISNKDDVQDIMDGMCNYIDVMEREVNNISTNK